MMTKESMKSIFATLAPFFGGLLFAIGLSLGGMTQPSKIVGFLDVTKNWDPTLLFVMFGAVSVYALSFRLIKKRNLPLFTDKFYIPNRRDIDARLIIGAAIFGIGWGIAGFCPGPGLAALVTGLPQVITFVIAMIVGMGSFYLYQKYEEKA